MFTVFRLCLLAIVYFLLTLVYCYLNEMSHSLNKSSVSRDRLVVRTLRCGRSNPGSNPGHGMQKQFFLLLTIKTMVKETKNRLPPMRIELMTFGLQDQRSATEL